MSEQRIPLKGGHEYDTLTKGGRAVHDFRPGERARAKRGYWKRFRRIVRRILRREDDE